MRVHPCPSYLQISGRSDQNWMTYADDKVKQRLFQQPRECNSKINDPIWPLFKLVWDFIYVHLSCKFQVVLIKTEGVMVTKKSIRSFFNNQGDIILRLMIPSGQILNLSFTYAHIICKFNKHLIKTESYADKVKQKLFQQSRGHNSKIDDPIWPIFELVQDCIHIHLICKFQEHPIKTEGVMVMTNIFPLYVHGTLWLP